MIRKDSHELYAEHKDSILTSAIYKGAVLVWQAVRSCFGGGTWLSAKPWLGEETWKNN